MAPPFKQVEFDIMYNEGISKAGDLIDLAVDKGIVKKSGAWFTYGEDRFQGREQFRTKIKEDESLRLGIEKDVKEALGMLADNVPKEEEKEVKETKKK